VEKFVALREFFSSALEGNAWITSFLGHFNPRERAPPSICIEYEAGWAPVYVLTLRRRNKLILFGIDLAS